MLDGTSAGAGMAFISSGSSRVPPGDKDRLASIRQQAHFCLTRPRWLAAGGNVHRQARRPCSD
ncbi:hypothetical protein GCM10017559_61300 [Streptosporangium longisporum]|uniref:Uncharacterized protein n=1 Tax=Streptosporangium longisporum TaxID=46187 RepID=A0ABP6L1H0_9ACTN